MSQKTRAGNAIFFHHIYAGFIEQPIHLMLKISTLPSDPHFGGIVISQVDCSMCWILPRFTFNMSCTTGGR